LAKKKTNTDPQLRNVGHQDVHPDNRSKRVQKATCNEEGSRKKRGLQKDQV